MNRIVFDTNIFISYNIFDKPTLLKKSTLSAVVLYELTCNPMDKFELEIFRRLKVAAEKEKRLLTPTTEDWWEAAKIVSRIRYGQKSDSYGLIPKDPHAERIQNDALIARTVYTTKCTLVTNNIDDFNRIKPFCKIKFVSGKDFFGY